MNIKRVLTALIGFPIVTLALVFGNSYIIDIAMAIVTAMAFYEYSHCINLKYKMIKWIGYLCCIFMAFLHIIPNEVYIGTIIIGIPTILLLLFMHIILTNMKIEFKDIAMSFIGICYIIPMKEIDMLEDDEIKSVKVSKLQKYKEAWHIIDEIAEQS